MLDPDLVYERLFARYGPQHWWPAETRFEVIVGALLMAQTSWERVEEAIENLKAAGALDAHRLAAMPLPKLRRLIQPAGLYRTKPHRLKAFCRHLVRSADGDLDRFFARAFETVRRELLTLDGVGPETADSILLYAADFPTFLVDAYTVRVGRRLGLFDTDGYEEVKAFFESRVPHDLTRYREYHALLVAHGSRVCRPKPRCAECPLNDVCAFAAENRAIPP
ncbi:MAG TPA: hypothetical protein VGR51_09230 [Thermoplasmata archaeon]|nr:hypothetical protein [Thermoplasmata archaeon]